MSFDYDLSSSSSSSNLTSTPSTNTYIFDTNIVPTFPVNEDGWPLSPDGYTLLEEIGQGAFAKVLKSYCKSKDTHVGVKIMALENINVSIEEIQSEVKAMKLNRHDAVLGLYCCFVVGSDLWLVMPLMDKGSAYYILRCLRRTGRIMEGQGLPEEIIATIIKELLEGLAYIHAQGQIHRDVKAGNVLLNSEGRVAIADFGVAGWMTEVGARAEVERKTFVGTPCWMAPEVMEQMRGYNEKADIWSVGITALELAKGYAPYAKYAPMQILIKTIREPPPSIKSYVDAPGVPPVQLSDKFHKFVARCLQKDPKQRSSAYELLSDPFIKRSIKTARLVELLKEIPPVGKGANSLQSSSSTSGADEKTPTGYGKLTLTAATTDDSLATQNLVPGTTWIFPDELKEQLGIGNNTDNININNINNYSNDGNFSYLDNSIITNTDHDRDGVTYADENEGVVNLGIANSGINGAIYGGNNHVDDEEDTSLDAIAAELEALGGENING